MKLSAEMSLYPLIEDYEKPILEFIDDLRSNPDLTVMVNTMSTQIFGDFDVVMSQLSKTMKGAFGEKISKILVVKFINSDLSPQDA